MLHIQRSSIDDQFSNRGCQNMSKLIIYDAKIVTLIIDHRCT